MAKGCTTNNTYEEARKQRLEENKKRFKDLGISMISKNLTELASPQKKILQRLPKPKSKSNGVVELRRSSRVRNSAPSYRDDDGIDLPPLRKRSRPYSSGWGSYVARPLDEVKEATEEERNYAYKLAEALLSNLQTSNPSFIKSMVRSHVYSCFWLGLPTKFCEEHLPKTVCDMVLEDENGSEYEAVFIGKRTGLSGGWRAFALDHKLDDGDALVFELIEPTRFKIYISRAFPDSVEDGQGNLEEEGNTCATEAPKATKKRESQSNKTQKPKQRIVHEINESATSQEHLTESKVDNEVDPQEVNPAKKTKLAQKKSQKESKDSELSDDGDSSKKEEHIEEGKNWATEKAKEAMKHKSQANKSRKSKHGIVHELGDSGSTQQPESNTENEEKTQLASTGKKSTFVQHAGSELKKVEPVEGASKKPRKKPAPKLFRKRA